MSTEFPQDFNEIETPENTVVEANTELQTELITQPDETPLTDEEVIVSYLRDEKVRKNLIETLLYYKKKLGSGDWFSLDKLVLKKTQFTPAEIKMHLRLLSLMKLVYTKVNKNNQQVYKITETIESRKHLIENELLLYKDKVKSLFDELSTINSTLQATESK